MEKRGWGGGDESWFREVKERETRNKFYNFFSSFFHFFLLTFFLSFFFCLPSSYFSSFCLLIYWTQFEMNVIKKKSLFIVSCTEEMYPKIGKKREKEGKCIKRCTKRWDSSSSFLSLIFPSFSHCHWYNSFLAGKKKEIRAKEERMKEETSASTCFHSREERERKEKNNTEEMKERGNLDTFTFPLDTFHRVFFSHLQFYFFYSLNFFSKLFLPLISLSFSYFFLFPLTSNIKLFKEWRRKKRKFENFLLFWKKMRWERRGTKKRKEKKSVEACRWRVEDTFLIQVTFIPSLFLLSSNSLPLFSFFLMSLSNDILSLETKIMREEVKERKLQKEQEEREKETRKKKLENGEREKFERKKERR